MRDETDKDVGILHDGYLKLYQLSQPKLDYDVILLDEAQDTNPVVADIIFSQDCPKILVGDRHQQIYTFRGARNAMENIRSSRTFYLTNSFRFGEDIALIANKVLKIFKNEKHQLKGVKLADHSSAPRDCAIIARTNAGLFDEAVRLLADYKIAFLGGIDGYQFNKILDAYHLYWGKRDNIRSKYIRGFGGYSALLDFAQEADDWELKSICRIVEKYKDGIPGLINGIKNSSVEKEKADVILTTAHKSKGSQFHNVQLIGDFPDLFKDGEIISKDKLKPDEFNLIYVAVTRAKETLDLSLYQDLGQFIMMELTTEDDPVTSSEKNHSPKEKRPEMDNTPGGPAAGPNIGSRQPEHVGSKPSEDYDEADVWGDADWAEYLGCDKDEVDNYFDSQM